MSEEKPKNPAAVELGKLGAAKGGKARMAAMSKEERSAFAKRAIAARWKKARELRKESPTRSD